MKVCLFGEQPRHKWIYMYTDVDMLARSNSTLASVFLFFFFGYGNFFCILINFYFVKYYNFLHTDPYEHVGKKKERKLNIYTLYTHTHNYILINNKNV